jgi:hypothetical protein
MRKRNVAAITIAALVAGLVVGSIGLASAATSQSPMGGARLQFRGAMRQAGSTLADVVAKLTGLSLTQVRTDRQAGKSFAEIAKAKGVGADQVVADTLTARKAALDAAVKSGRITQAQADAALATMKTRLTDRVSSTTPGCNGAGAGRGAGGGGYGRGGGCGGACLGSAGQ